MAELKLSVERAVLPQRWNGPDSREKRNAQRSLGSKRKKSIRNKGIANLIRLEELLTEIIVAKRRSLVLDKELLADITRLKQDPLLSGSVDLKAELRGIMERQKDESEARRLMVTRQKDIKEQVAILKENGLSGARIRGRRSAGMPQARAIAEMEPGEHNSK